MTYRDLIANIVRTVEDLNSEVVVRIVSRDEYCCVNSSQHVTTHRIGAHGKIILEARDIEEAELHSS